MGGVTVRLAGPFAVLRNGPSEDRVGLGSRKARRLLALLAVRRGHVVPIPQIIDVLWADRPPLRPVQDLATLVSRLRALVGADTVIGGREGYTLGVPPAVTVDLDDAARLVAECAHLIDGSPTAPCWPVIKPWPCSAQDPCYPPNRTATGRRRRGPSTTRCCGRPGTPPPGRPSARPTRTPPAGSRTPRCRPTASTKRLTGC
jgi:DNA-binding transcriptional activator of the SARP family